jgi:allantoinase
MPDLVIRGRRVVMPEGVGPASIHIRNGVIDAVRAFDDVPPGGPVESVIMPGLVDTHVHINEPGRTEWEGFESATRSAAAGGITTLIDMPLNSIPATTTVEGFRAKLDAARGKCWVDVGFWGGVVPENASELRPLLKAGVLGFKCFLVPSGVPEFSHVGEHDLRLAMPELSSAGAVLLAHAELPEFLRPVSGGQYSDHLRSRPRQAEDEAIALLVRLSREFGTRVHVVHLSSSDALPLLDKVTVETCPHYLTFAAEEIPDGAPEYKCAPPIRERENRECLWAALGAGVIGMIASDHSPCPPALKRGDFANAWGGISSLQISLPVVWTEARRRGYSLSNLVEWMCRAPARLAGLDRRKGAIAAGYDADLVSWNPEATFQVEPAKLHHRHKLTPYAGHLLHGVVEKTFLRGQKIYDNEHFPAGPIGCTLPN